ncbi:MAG: hypothetical protein O2898_01100 [Proteobacteria bacterium]|nr:hypothetical protein [Pseudomonadota bacterium]
MFHTTPATPDPARPALDCETAMLLRSFLLPVIEAAGTWADLSTRLGGMGYDIAFRHGHLIFRHSDTGDEVCTGQTLGAPLRDLSRRLGRPCITAAPDGQSGRLRV